MSRLLIDVGNTRAVAARLAGGATTGAFEPLVVEPTPPTAAAAAELAARLAALRLAGEQAAATSVVPRVSRALCAGLADLQLVDHTWDFPFAVDIVRPETVGADRWCNLAAAAGSGLGDALIVDAGTATTIDVLVAGVFKGGLIAPGMAFAAHQLQTAAAQLWPVPFTACALTPGRDTEQALRVGAFHVGVNGVAGTVATLCRQWPQAAVILTGGLGRYLARSDWRYDPDWTLRGLAVLLDRRPTCP